MKGIRAGQRGAQSAVVTTDALEISVFATPLGYWAVCGRDEVVYGLTLGQPAAHAAFSAFGLEFQGLPVESSARDWYPGLRQRLERYAAGCRDRFDDVRLFLPQMTPFQQSVVEATRRLKFGETVTYGELAALADRPRAARAVGTVMSSNRIPILIPCHRVVGAGGCLGGYSAPQGLSLKARLLELERSG